MHDSTSTLGSGSSRTVSRVPDGAEAAVPVAASSRHHESVPAPLEPTRDIGWLVMLVSAVLALWASWMLFPKDAVGMWAGYWVSAASTIALLASMWLRSALPSAPAICGAAIVGGVVALLGVLRDYPPTISITMAAGGLGIALGAVMQTVRHPSRQSTSA